MVNVYEKESAAYYRLLRATIRIFEYCSIQLRNRFMQWQDISVIQILIQILIQQIISIRYERYRLSCVVSVS